MPTLRSYSILAISLIVLPLVGCEQATDNLQHNKELVLDVVAAIDEQDYDRLRELWPEESVHRMVGVPEPMSRDAVIELIQGFYTAFPDNSHEIHEIVAEGDLVAVRMTNNSTHQGDFEGIAATGQTISYEAAHIVRFQSGVIREWWLIEDRFGQKSQMGMELRPKE